MGRATRRFDYVRADEGPRKAWQPIDYFTALMALFTAVYASVSVLQGFYSQRADVKAQVGSIFLKETYPGASVNILNIGQNPAYYATDWMLINIFCPPFPSGSALPVWPVNPPTTLWPKEENVILTVHMTRNLQPGEKDLILAGKEEIFFWGRIEYRTFWIPRYTNFCFHTTGEASDASHIAIRPCDAHNDAD